MLNDPRLSDGIGQLPDAPPLAHGGGISLYEDWVVAKDEVHAYELLKWPMTATVHAVADTEGNISVTRGRNLAQRPLAV